jgi:hypothetical protein
MSRRHHRGDRDIRPHREPFLAAGALVLADGKLRLAN